MRVSGGFADLGRPTGRSVPARLGFARGGRRIGCRRGAPGGGFGLLFLRRRGRGRLGGGRRVLDRGGGFGRAAVCSVFVCDVFIGDIFFIGGDRLGRLILDGFVIRSPAGFAGRVTAAAFDCIARFGGCRFAGRRTPAVMAGVGAVGRFGIGSGIRPVSWPPAGRAGTLRRIAQGLPLLSVAGTLGALSLSIHN